MDKKKVLYTNLFCRKKYIKIHQTPKVQKFLF